MATSLKSVSAQVIGASDINAIERAPEEAIEASTAQAMGSVPAEIIGVSTIKAIEIAPA
jgi:hypothetical protein